MSIFFPPVTCLRSWTGSGCERRFYISRNHDGCEVDTGWLVMITASDVCTWGNPPGMTHPTFFYSNISTAAPAWLSGQYLKLVNMVLGVSSILDTNFLVKSPTKSPILNLQFVFFKSPKYAVQFSYGCMFEMFIATELYNTFW